MTDINNLKKQTNNTTFLNLRGAFTRCQSYTMPFLVWKSVLIIWPWGCCHFTGLISFFRNFIKINQSLNHLGLFFANKEEGVLHCSQNLSKGKNLPIKLPDVHAQDTIRLCLYYYVFVMSYYMFKMFLFAMFGKLTIVFIESSVSFKTPVRLKSL